MAGTPSGVLADGYAALETRDKTAVSPDLYSHPIIRHNTGALAMDREKSEKVNITDKMSWNRMGRDGIIRKLKKSLLMECGR
jgi:hypothetical protein